MEESQRHREYNITGNLPDIYIFICNALLDFTVQCGNRGKEFQKTHSSVGVFWPHAFAFPDVSSPSLTHPFFDLRKIFSNLSISTLLQPFSCFFLLLLPRSHSLSLQLLYLENTASSFPFPTFIPNLYTLIPGLTQTYLSSPALHTGSQALEKYAQLGGWMLPDI